MRKQVAFIVPSLLLTLFVTACGQSASPAPSAKTDAPSVSATPATAPAASASKPAVALKKVSISVPGKNFSTMPYFIGADKGIFKAEGIDLDVQDLKSVAAIAAMVSGDVPYTGSTGSAMRSVVTGGADLKVVLITVDNTTFSLFGAKDIKTIKDLAGKPVMVSNSGSSDHYAVKKILENGGMDPNKSVSIVSAATTENRYQALLGGATKGAILLAPFSQMAEELGYTRLKNAYDLMRRQSGGIAVSAKYLQNNKEEVTKMIRGAMNSVKYIHEKPQETIEFITKSFELKPELAKKAYEEYVNFLSKDGMMDEKYFQEEIEEVNAESGIKYNGKVSDIVDFSIVKSLK